jgi:hypothetical protein
MMSLRDKKRIQKKKDRLWRRLQNVTVYVEFKRAKNWR